MRLWFVRTPISSIISAVLSGAHTDLSFSAAGANWAMIYTSAEITPILKPLFFPIFSLIEVKTLAVFSVCQFLLRRISAKEFCFRSLIAIKDLLKGAYSQSSYNSADSGRDTSTFLFSTLCNSL